MSNPRERELAIDAESDLVVVRKTVREAASEIGFGITDVTRIVTAASELSRNVLRYAGSGVMRLGVRDSAGRVGIELVFEDQGPGIPDVEVAMQEGHSSARGLGMGLPGTKRLMDEMTIQSAVGEGTTVTIRKWRENT